MKKYDLHKIMSNAHKLYKNARAKYSTFASALKKAWSMAKFEVKVAAGRVVLQAERKAEEAAMSKHEPVQIKRYSLGDVTAADIYPDNNRGYLGSKYCGD